MKSDYKVISSIPVKNIVIAVVCFVVFTLFMVWNYHSMKSMVVIRCDGDKVIGRLNWPDHHQNGDVICIDKNDKHYSAVTFGTRTLY